MADPIPLDVKENVWDNDEKDGKLLIETSPFSRYSSEMDAIIDAIKTDPESYYIIITDLPNTFGYAGCMPLKSDFAFLFTNQSTTQKAAYQTIAHELGHGAFYLKHIDAEYKILDATDNLMNRFVAGTALWKPQWDWIGDPSWRLYMFQKEEEGAMKAIVFDAEYVVVADDIVSKYFDLQHNKKNIWDDLNSETLVFLQTAKGKMLFPNTATAGNVQEFLALVESLWQEHFMTSFLETPNYHPYATYKSRISTAKDATAKALIIIERGNEVRNKFEGLNIIVDQTFSFILDAAGGTLGATTAMNVVRGSKRTFKLPKSEVSCEVVKDVATVTRGTAEEVAEAAEKIKNYRIAQNAGKSGNYGYLEGTINGEVVNNKMWRSVSLDQARKEIHIFDAIEATSSNGNTWLCITDSEYRMLNQLAKDLRASKGAKYPDITGVLKIVSENSYCASCQGIIQQFRKMFPNIKLILIDGTK